MSKQRENENSVRQTGQQLLKDKDVVSENVNQTKLDYEGKKQSVTKDIEHSKNYQKLTSTFDADNVKNIRKK